MRSLYVSERFGRGFSLKKGFDLCVAVVNGFVYCFGRVETLVACRLPSGFLDAFPRVFDLEGHYKPA